MRIRVDLSKTSFKVPINYQQILQGFIYNTFDRETTGDFLHNTGYSVYNKIFKLFCFSNLFGTYTLENRTLVFEEDFYFYIKYYSDWVTKELKEGKNNDVEMVDFAYADFNESDEKLDYGYAKQVLRDIISSLSLLLSIEGVSQEKIINTFMKVKIFVNYFNGYILNVLYKEGWEKLLRKTIETMPEGLRKEYAKTMNFRYWIVETLIERGTISEDMLKQELNKIIDYGMKCIEGFRKLEYPCENIASIFPDKYVMAKLSESKNSG